MDDATLLARLEKARECTVAVGEWTFRLRLPSDFESRRLAMAPRPDGDAGTQALARALVQTSVIGWTGPTVGAVLDDAAPDEAAAPLPFSPATLTALLDSRLDVFDALVTAFVAERQRRADAREAALKNAASASSGTSTSPTGNG